MSKFSGKCDFYDHLSMYGNDEEEVFKKFQGTKLYKMKPSAECVPVKAISDFSRNWIPIQYRSLQDLIPYYPYIISMSFCDKADSGNSTVILSSKSWVDIEEMRYGHWNIHDYYRDALRKEMERYSV